MRKGRWPVSAVAIQANGSHACGPASPAIAPPALSSTPRTRYADVAACLQDEAATPVRSCRKPPDRGRKNRSEEHTSELQSLMRISYAVFCLKKKNKYQPEINT